MTKTGFILKILDNLESYVCRGLLVLFVLLLFAQIVSREVFEQSLSWSEELAVYMFVWFVFFGASYAAKLSAHNRVTFHFKWLPRKMAIGMEALADLIWIAFNCYFVYLSYDFVFNKMNLFWKSQTLGVPMMYIYLILPVAFSLMTIRIIQVNYYKFVKGIDVRDPESLELEELTDSSSDQNDAQKNNNAAP
ncbi:MAG: C4-dicarboxylate transporter DctQ subunit [Motiliproteus sp.]|jgi:C4-dicarboxylate transporter DctQ subunit